METEIKHDILKAYELKNSKIEFWEEDLVYIEIYPNTEIDLDAAITQYNILKENRSKDKLYFVLVDSGKFTTITKEARDFSAKPESNDMSYALAVVIYSLAQRLIINFHSRFISRQKMKLKAFQNKEDALNWLMDLKKAKVN